jgi:hypothetical protein
MKRFALTFSLLCAIGALATIANAGSYSGKEVMQPAPPPCEWYRANEWNLDIWGTIAFPWNTGDRRVDPNSMTNDGTIENTAQEPKHEEINQGRTSNDRFINRDNAWGGGADLKYFFSKYWALGGEGFVLDANDNDGGAGLFTATFRFPIGCSRFAPYAFAGVGAASGGTETDQFSVENHRTNRQQQIVETENIVQRSINNTHTGAIGQFGAGLEVRITRHVGFMGDFAWNVLQRDHNDFGMARFGVTLSY